MTPYRVVYADPPWAYTNWKSKENGAAKSHYQTFTHEDMCGWNVQSLAAPDSLLFMWATFPKLPEALQVMQAWGFTYVTTPFVWNKVYQDGSPYCGLGFWSRSGTEIVLLGKRGKGVPREKGATNVRQVIVSAVVGKHSAKPPEVRERIETLTGGAQPRIELFARERAPGWDATGLDLDGKYLHEFIQEHEACLSSNSSSTTPSADS